jgi:uncharacterized protein YggE
MYLTKHLGAAFLCLLAPAAHSQSLNNPASELSAPHLTAQGHAEIKTKADVANLTISVKVAARLETDAAQQNAARTTALMAKIRALPGVRREDIQTADYAVTRQFSNTATPVFVAYAVTNTVQVTLHTVSEVSRLIDLTAGAGVTRITGLTFTLADRQAAEQRALTLAVANARGRAQTMASALGMTLGRLRVVSDSSSAFDANGNSVDGAVYALNGVSTATPISAQFITVRADASVDYNLEPRTPAP